MLVTKEHTFTTDTFLLARFSLPGPGEACADFGTGCGTIPMLWELWGEPGSILAVELCPEAAALAKTSAEENGFSNLTVLEGDVRDFRAFLSHEGLDLIACNPPYYPAGSGKKGAASRAAARCDETLTLRDLLAAARYGLRFGGRLCLCLPTERMAEALSLFSAGGLEPKRLRLVQSGPRKAPYLFLLECKKGGRAGLAVEPNLVLNDETGAPTPELREIYGADTETADER